MRKTKDVEIMGRSVILSERNASDVLKLLDYASKVEVDVPMSIFISASVVVDAIKPSCSWFKWHFYYKWIFTAKKLVQKLSQREILELANEVRVLDGSDGKKKVAENQSGEMSQDA